MVIFNTGGYEYAFDREQEVIYRATSGIPDTSYIVSSSHTNEIFNSRILQGVWTVIKDDTEEEFLKASEGYEI